MPDGIFSISVELQIMQVFKVDPVHLAEAQKLKAHLEASRKAAQERKQARVNAQQLPAAQPAPHIQSSQVPLSSDSGFPVVSGWCSDGGCTPNRYGCKD